MIKKLFIVSAMFITAGLALMTLAGCPPKQDTPDYQMRQTIAEATRDGYLHWKLNLKLSSPEFWYFEASTKDGDLVIATFRTSDKTREKLSYHTYDAATSRLVLYREWPFSETTKEQDEMLNDVLRPMMPGNRTVQDPAVERLRRQVLPVEETGR